ncbi:hypothetical protein CXG81DRAFT_17047 [Caulochytrium protostelioides]|uniref:Arrestin-like N-terminal domain-containing protein n=1 Tax=Caulochytrium protostelioides TaxID=1555241 RepID=A0A4P9XD93_9FUNG|nr:hypothetical protein CXG81DRAFT_17047 [Caulochytrium protostelioides]|eukprot:RKP03425.1 hypothetical protein CXG81DRAFT_17047 [Caulochytrium protostelioides]
MEALYNSIAESPMDGDHTLAQDEIMDVAAIADHAERSADAARAAAQSAAAPSTRQARLTSMLMRWPKPAVGAAPRGRRSSALAGQATSASPADGLTAMHITLAGGRTIFLPGQRIEGTVVCITPVPLPVHLLRLRFSGHIHTFQSRSDPLHTSLREDLFVDFITLFGRGRDHPSGLVLPALHEPMLLPAGENRFPFRLFMPEMDLPASYIGGHGEIHYEIRVCATYPRGARRYQMCALPITVPSTLAGTSAWLTEPAGQTLCVAPEPQRLRQALSKVLVWRPRAPPPRLVHLDVSLPRRGYATEEACRIAFHFALGSHPSPSTLTAPGGSADAGGNEIRIEIMAATLKQHATYRHSAETISQVQTEKSFRQLIQHTIKLDAIRDQRRPKDGADGPDGGAGAGAGGCAAGVPYDLRFPIPAASLISPAIDTSLVRVFHVLTIHLRIRSGAVPAVFARPLIPTHDLETPFIQARTAYGGKRLTLDIPIVITGFPAVIRRSSIETLPEYMPAAAAAMAAAMGTSPTAVAAAAAATILPTPAPILPVLVTALAPAAEPEADAPAEPVGTPAVPSLHVPPAAAAAAATAVTTSSAVNAARDALAAWSHSSDLYRRLQSVMAERDAPPLTPLSEMGPATSLDSVAWTVRATVGADADGGDGAGASANGDAEGDVDPFGAGFDDVDAAWMAPPSTTPPPEVVAQAEHARMAVIAAATTPLLLSPPTPPAAVKALATAASSSLTASDATAVAADTIESGTLLGPLSMTASATPLRTAPVVETWHPLSVPTTPTACHLRRTWGRNERPGLGQALFADDEGAEGGGAGTAAEGGGTAALPFTASETARGHGLLLRASPSRCPVLAKRRDSEVAPMLIAVSAAAAASDLPALPSPMGREAAALALGETTETVAVRIDGLQSKSSSPCRGSSAAVPGRLPLPMPLPSASPPAAAASAAA